jgi:hypothetical protein
MRELALHLLDLAENGVAAGARLIRILIREDGREERVGITVEDDGRGIPAALQPRAPDPFYTTRTTRRVGLGLSLFKEAAQRCGGRFRLSSEEGKGTRVYGSFRRDHIDLAPLGDVASSLAALITGNPEVDFFYRHEVDGAGYELDTRRIRNELEGVPIRHPAVLRYLSESIREGLREIGAGQFSGSFRASPSSSPSRSGKRSG